MVTTLERFILIKNLANRWKHQPDIAIYAKFMLLTAFIFILAIIPQVVFAEGAFISAPSRIDMVHDQSRNILYITNGDSVLRFDLNSNEFLSPFELGGQLMGIDISPDNNILLVADKSDSKIHQIDLLTGQSKKVIFAKAWGEGGTYSIAFGNDGNALVTSTFNGSGWVPLRKYNLITGDVTILASVRQDTMLRASADRSVIGFAESNSSDGLFGRYRVSDGEILGRSGYDYGTSWFNYEIAVNRNGTQYAIPTYGGTFIADSNVIKIDTVGAYAGGQPIGAVYSPIQDIVYFPWAGTTKVYAFDSNTLNLITEYDFENIFNHPGNHAYTEGRMKISNDGKYLFSTVDGGVRFITLSISINNNNIPMANSQIEMIDEDYSTEINLTATDKDNDPLSYVIVNNPQHGKIIGDGPNKIYIPNKDYNGLDQFTFRAYDGKSYSLLAKVSIYINEVNDSPNFTLMGSKITIKQQSITNKDIAGWVSNISPGPADETTQRVKFIVTTNKKWLFSEQPQISSGGVLTFKPDRIRRGTAIIKVIAKDNGGTESGGIDMSAPQRFKIRVARIRN